eukprot:Gregarina_sp_Poly_1__1033@NODE_1253_length_4621_cov_230_546552_g854_i0_p6_GENE_NODE_1253_length_4621_cov_230_546552_g854_i0NODE_1253_length_4621_cov_230_546552_g854_i0_p6_ORF_typecomplete_len104_score3_57C2/PF00168_30/0_013_NODE_1253_length_4621_cov_230_546552_g854_i016241935
MRRSSLAHFCQTIRIEVWDKEFLSDGKMIGFGRLEADQIATGYSGPVPVRNSRVIHVCVGVWECVNMCEGMCVVSEIIPCCQLQHFCRPAGVLKVSICRAKIG